jgi:hypothetical protein
MIYAYNKIDIQQSHVLTNRIKHIFPYIVATLRDVVLFIK